MTKGVQRLVAALLLAVSLVITTSTAMAAPSVLASPFDESLNAPLATSPMVPSKPSADPVPTEEECNGDQVCISGVKTRIIKEAIEAFLGVFRKNLPRIIREIENVPIPDSWKRHMRTNLPMIKDTLEGLLQWETLVWETIQDQVTAAGVVIGIPITVARLIGMGTRYLLEWVVF